MLSKLTPFFLFFLFFSRDVTTAIFNCRIIGKRFNFSTVFYPVLYLFVIHHESFCIHNFRSPIESTNLADPGKKNFIETTYAILSLSFSLSLIFILPGKSNSDSCSKLVNKFQSYFVNGNEIIPRNCTILFHANVAAIYDL